MAKTTLNKNKICSRCGRKLKLLETVDNFGRPTKWRGCDNCNHFDNGVNPKVFEIAKKLLFEYQRSCYTWIERPMLMYEKKIKTLEEAESTKNNDVVHYCYSQLGGFSDFIERILFLYEND